MRVLSLMLVLILVAASQCASRRDDTLVMHEFDHFIFFAHGLGGSGFDDANAELEKQYDSILNHLGLAAVNKVSFHVFRDANSLHEEFTRKFPSILVPDFATGLSPSPTEVYLVYPSSGFYTGYIHEFTHCMTQNVNPTIPNHPRWLWESIALFEAGEFTHPRNVAALASHAPGFDELNNFNSTTIYQVGYLLGEFIFKKYGREKYIELIKENGDLEQVLGSNDQEFLDLWYAYLKLNYNF